MIHELKCWPNQFSAIKQGAKTFEVRSTADRDFAVGNALRLRKWDPAIRAYEDSGGEPHSVAELADTLLCEVTYIVHGGQFGLPPGMCVMAIRVVE